MQQIVLAEIGKSLSCWPFHEKLPMLSQANMPDYSNLHILLPNLLEQMEQFLGYRVMIKLFHFLGNPKFLLYKVDYYTNPTVG